MTDPSKVGRPQPALFEYGTVYPRLTHYLFRYPAKFHPPIVRSLIERLTEPGATLFDPFIGSGTAGIEAMVAGRNAVGLDVDPVAVAVARVKTHRYQMRSLRCNAEALLETLTKHERAATEYKKRMFVDLSPASLAGELRSVKKYVPAIPSIEHWFRRYVIVDLAKIRGAIEILEMPESHRDFLRIIFSSIIRNASNADPVPVSGLEVTSHMRRKDEEGRLVNPFALFRKALANGLDAVEQFADATDRHCSARIRLGDATSVRLKQVNFDAVINSAPYHGAVDYYRRHKLEMYWLAHTHSENDRHDLLDRYIGRVSVPRRNRFLSYPTIGPLSSHWEQTLRKIKQHRATTFRHYQSTMRSVFQNL